MLFCVIQVIVGALISFSLLTSRLNYLSVSLMSLFVPRPVLEYLNHPPLPNIFNMSFGSDTQQRKTVGLQVQLHHSSLSAKQLAIRTNKTRWKKSGERSRYGKCSLYCRNDLLQIAESNGTEITGPAWREQELLKKWNSEEEIF